MEEVWIMIPGEWDIDRSAFDSLMNFIFSRKWVDSVFEQNYLTGHSTSEVLANLDTLHRYSNNYVIFSPVLELSVPESLMTPERLFFEFV